MSTTIDYAARREELRRRYLTSKAEGGRTTGVGVNHLALICSDIERTIEFYTEALGFPLTELFQNRDLPQLDPLLLRHRQRQPPGLLRLSRAPHATRTRVDRRHAPHCHLGGPGAIREHLPEAAGAWYRQSRAAAGHRLRLLPRPRWRAHRDYEAPTPLLAAVPEKLLAELGRRLLFRLNERRYTSRRRRTKLKLRTAGSELNFVLRGSDSN